MAREVKGLEAKRREELRQMLSRLRDETYMKIRELRRDQEHEAEPPPADDIDAARATADVEMHASLIERAEEALKSIDEALERVEHERYGMCTDCGQEISVERLTAVPFALRCESCQEKQNHVTGRRGEGEMIAPYNRQWTLPEEMHEPREYRIKSTGGLRSPIYEEPFPKKPPIGEKAAAPVQRGAPAKGKRKPKHIK